MKGTLYRVPFILCLCNPAAFGACKRGRGAVACPAGRGLSFKVSVKSPGKTAAAR